jgi:hypothetical protein
MTRPVPRVATPTFASPTARVSSWRRSVSTCPAPRRRGDRMRRRFFLALTVITLALAWAGARRRFAASTPHCPAPWRIAGDCRTVAGRFSRRIARAGVRGTPRLRNRVPIRRRRSGPAPKTCGRAGPPSSRRNRSGRYCRCTGVKASWTKRSNRDCSRNQSRPVRPR